MHSYGIHNEHIFADIEELTNAINSSTPDLVIIDADLIPSAFDLVHDIRHFKIGRNPFIIVSLMVDARVEGAAQRAILAGADDVIIKPVAPGMLMDRVTHFALHRLPFIATSDYIGPERRRSGDSRPTKIKHIDVVNTLKAKIEGSPLSMAALDRAVKSNIGEVMAARLDSNGLKLGSVCGLILKAYEAGRVDKSVEDLLLILVQALEEAARTARALGDSDLSQICRKLAPDVENMSENYKRPTSAQFSTLQMLTAMFDLAKTAKVAHLPL